MEDAYDVFTQPSEDVMKAKEKVDGIKDDIDSVTSELADIVFDNCEEADCVNDEYKDKMVSALSKLRDAKMDMKPPEVGDGDE